MKNPALPHVFHRRRSRTLHTPQPLLALTALALLAVAPAASAVSPPPDGGYSGQNTAEGSNALFSADVNISGAINDTAIGYEALHEDTAGSYNTAVGSAALHSVTGHLQHSRRLCGAGDKYRLL